MLFHNGREMTAVDVVKSWERLYDPQLASPGPDFFGIIQGADALLAGDAGTLRGLTVTDRYTLRVVLTQPDPTFAHVVALMFATVVPIQEVQRLGDDWSNTPVVTGPFKVTERVIGEYTRFERNPDYFVEGQPCLDAVEMTARVPREVQFMRLEADELQEVGRITAGSSWVPPALAAHEDGPPYQTYDPDLARECMRNAGYPAGHPEPVRYMTLTDEASIVTALSIQQDLAQIGIPIEIQNTTLPVYLTATGRRDTVAMAYTARVMDSPTLATSWRPGSTATRSATRTRSTTPSTATPRPTLSSTKPPPSSTPPAARSSTRRPSGSSPLTPPMPSSTTR